MTLREQWVIVTDQLTSAQFDVLFEAGVHPGDKPWIFS